MKKRLNQISVSIASVYRGIQKCNSEALAKFGMNNVNAICLYAIGLNPGISATEICKATATDKAAVSKSIHHLIANGYVERPLVSKRAYRSGIFLTEKGNRLFEIMNEHMTGRAYLAFKNISDKDYKAFVEVLDAIALNLNENL